MEKVNHWNEDNTTALITGITGIAGSIIDKQKIGAAVTAAEQKVASLSKQTLEALGLAQQQQAVAPPTPKGLSGTTMLLIGGGVLLLIVAVLVFKSRK